MATREKTDPMADLRSKAVFLLKPYASRISVFGSYARGESGPASDIDILVALKPAARRPPLGLKWFSIEAELGRLMGRRIELISEKEISPHLKPYIEPDIVLLYEEN